MYSYANNHKVLASYRLTEWFLFRPGSVVVKYEVTTTAVSPELIHKANEQVLQNLSQTYKMDYNSFQTVTSSK